MNGFKSLGLLVIATSLVFFIFGSDNSPSKESYSASQVQTYEDPITKTTSDDYKCHPNYSGCLRVDASDYDCIGGSGDGPYYTGPVMVIGPDVFGLDRDHDGIGCE